MNDSDETIFLLDECIKRGVIPSNIRFGKASVEFQSKPNPNINISTEPPRSPEDIKRDIEKIKFFNG
jgi:hypothetical protein